MFIIFNEQAKNIMGEKSNLQDAMAYAKIRRCRNPEHTIGISYLGRTIRRYGVVNDETIELPCLVKPEQIEFENKFTVEVGHCNWSQDRFGNLKYNLFGGALVSQMDIAAAMAARRAFYNTGILNSVTVGMEKIAFFVGAKIGDMVHMNAKIVKIGIKSITIEINGRRENKATGAIDKLCTGLFTFVSVDDDEKAIRHNLTLDA